MRVDWDDAPRLTWYSVGALALRRRRGMMLWGLLGAAAFALPVVLKPREYASSAAFIARGADANRSSLVSLAAQFGATLPTGSASQSVDFYAYLLKSRALMSTLLTDTVAAPSRRPAATLPDLLGLHGTPAQREQAMIEWLGRNVSTSVTRTTGVVSVTVKSPWPEVSQAVATQLLAGINAFNRQVKQQEASTERRFVEDRLTEARAELTRAEDELDAFLRGNRQIGSGGLTFSPQRDRYQRAVQLKSALVTQLAQSYEDVRIREVRDVPVIQVVDAPNPPLAPLPRGGLTRAVLGAVLGTALYLFVCWLIELHRHRRRLGDPTVAEFVATLGELRRAFRRQALRESEPAGTRAAP